MTLSKEQLLEVTLQALGDALKEKGAPLPADASAATVVFGKDSTLDSLGLVTMIMELEARMEEQHGVTVVLADEKAMSRRHSPFRTVGTLVDYMLEQLTPAPS